MGVFFGSKKYKLNLGEVRYTPNVILKDPSKISGRLISSDNYILKDSNGLYITVKESK